MSAVLPPQGGFPFPSAGASLANAVRSAPGAALAFQGVGGAKRSTGLIVVVAVHVLFGWALASGLARKAVEIVKRPIEMVIVPEEIAPPPPPPPKIEKTKDMPKIETPPPAYVPPPEVVLVAPPPAPVIQAVQAEPPKAPVIIAPPPPPAPAPEPKPAVVKQEISVACPGYKSVLPQMLEEAFDRIGVPGTVKVLIKVKGNQVTEVLPLSGPKEYYKFLPATIKRSMRCSAGGDNEVQATLDVVFQQ
ncbi:MAG: energy transducer TonB [Leptothrix sp. (in: b-proteobacteria)]